MLECDPTLELRQWLIMYGKGGEFAANRHEDQEITMPASHLLVYINTLMMQ